MWQNGQGRRVAFWSTSRMRTITSTCKSTLINQCAESVRHDMTEDQFKMGESPTVSVHSCGDLTVRGWAEAKRTNQRRLPYRRNGQGIRLDSQGSLYLYLPREAITDLGRVDGDLPGLNSSPAQSPAEIYSRRRRICSGQRCRLGALSHGDVPPAI